MLSEPQLACLILPAAAMVVGSIIALADVCGRAIGGCATPVEADVTLRVIAGHASRLVFLVPAVVTGAAAMAFALHRRVRP